MDCRGVVGNLILVGQPVNTKWPKDIGMAAIPPATPEPQIPFTVIAGVANPCLLFGT